MLLFLYRILINIVFIISPFIVLIRLFKNKEDLFRFKEKYCLFSKKKNGSKLIWFHGASVGELLSVIPLIEKLEKNKKISQILVTSSTLSSSKVFKKFKFKKTIHQFFPIDTNFLSNSFLNYWKPSLAIFIDSEIWPNMLLNLKKNSVPSVLLNARITNKSFKRWKFFKNFSKEIFQCFTKAIPSNKETIRYLNFLGLKKIRFIGNLKFSQNNSSKLIIPGKVKKFFSNKISWCASSTHETEELYCIKSHISLKKKYKNFVTIIIPRHTNRCEDLIETFKKNKLTVHCHSWSQDISKNTDIYLVDTYGETNLFFNLSKVVFVGGSLIKHGGQNPLEPVRFGCRVIHGPHIENFKEIYKLLKNLKISNKVLSETTLTKNVKKLIKNKSGSRLVIKKIRNLGVKILSFTLKEVNKDLS